MNEEERKVCFNKLHEFMTSNELDMSSDIKSIFQDHLLHLNNWFEKYFKNENIDRLTWDLRSFQRVCSVRLYICRRRKPN